MILFLDIDGVIRGFNEEELDFLYKDVMCRKFTKKSVKALNYIIRETNCDIVITSDWRNDYTLEQLQIIFEYNKIIKLPIDVTTFTKTNAMYLERDRVNEIKKWLSENPTDNYCVVDDMELKIENFVCCNEPYVLGIKEKGIKENIIKILKYGISNR